MKKRYKIPLLVIFSIIILYLIALKPVNDSNFIRKKIFLRKAEKNYPKVGNDTQIKIKNRNREVAGLLSKNGKKLLILFHGNGATINNFKYTAKTFYNKGYSTLLIEYPGYGLSYKYKATERNIYADCTKIIKYVQEKYKYKKEDTYLLGWSLGSAVAIEMSKRKLGSKLIIVSAFTSMPDVAHEKFVKYLPYLVMIDKFSNKLKAKFIKIPVLILHGKKDRLVSYKMGVKLDKLFPNSELISIKNADHVDIFKHINKNQWKKIYSFLEQ